MSKTALIDALTKFDLDQVRTILERNPELKRLQIDKGFNILQFCCRRRTDGNTGAAQRQLRLARWLVSEGFDPKQTYTFAAGEDGEEEPATVSLAWFAVAKAQNNRLARYFLQQGAAPGALFAAAWWGNADIVPDLVRHGADLNEVVEGGTPLYMAVDVLRRGVEGKPKLERQRMELLKTILRLGADPDMRAPRGTTRLHLAINRGHGAEVFKLLLKHGADPDIPGKDGQTVRQIALRKRDKQYLNALRETRVRLESKT